MKNIVVLVSGGGTNLQALIDAEKRGEIKGGKITCVISSKPGVYALERASNNNIPTVVIPRKDYGSAKEYSEAMLAELKKQNAGLIVLAGFMTILDECVTREYPYKIINVHPALIPSFCGEGFYGLRVHKAALDYGVKVSGATIHFVNEKADAGAIILQGTVDVANDETPESLQKKIMENVEWKLLPKAVSLFCEDRITVKDGKAYVDCENCGDLRLVKLFRSPYEYLQCIDYIKALIKDGGFEFVEGNCSLDEVKDKEGCWADDIIYHVIKCKKCGQVYSCCCNTYRGGGSFMKER